MIRRVLATLALAAALAAPLALRAQDATPAPATAAETAAVQAPAAAEGAVTTSSGLPSREAPPRTMRAYWHVFAAFAIAWALLIGYALSLGRRFTRVEEELQRLGAKG